MNLKRKMYRSPLVHGAEPLTARKSQERGLDVNEMRMLKWMYGSWRKIRLEVSMLEDT